MSQQTLLGGDGTTGETGATHNSKANSNFTELYGATAAAQADADAAQTAISDHISNGVGAHAASAIAFSPYSTIAATTVQTAIQEMLDEGVSVPDADATTKGIGKLYTSTGTGTDGSMTRTAITAALGAVSNSFTFLTKSASYTIGADVKAILDVSGIPFIEMDSASGLNLTVPSDATQAIDIGDSIWYRQKGVGQVTVVQGSSATLQAPLSANKSFAQHSIGCLTKVAANTWLHSGDITV